MPVVEAASFEKGVTEGMEGVSGTEGIEGVSGTEGIEGMS